ncbi:MAG TPA: hypothetical protein VFX44_04280 [Solirubrobacterales bacterium]|nr:hypothetical protein [Solirubrobacterales bacterium]
MSERDERVEELLQVNARLAAEVRNLTLGSTDGPRPAGMPASRRLARLIGERDELLAELYSAQSDLELAEKHRSDLERQNQALAAEIARLSTGLPGMLRRIRGRLRGGGSA